MRLVIFIYLQITNKNFPLVKALVDKQISECMRSGRDLSLGSTEIKVQALINRNVYSKSLHYQELTKVMSEEMIQFAEYQRS